MQKEKGEEKLLTSMDYHKGQNIISLNNYTTQNNLNNNDNIILLDQFKDYISYNELHPITDRERRIIIISNCISGWRTSVSCQRS